MTAIVPDTLQGALIVSVIDFFLSFVIISGIGLVLALFPLLNRLAPKAAQTAQKKATAENRGAAQTAAKAELETHDDIAAIAAAVLVVMDGAPHRILHVEPSQRSGWVAEGRTAHHGSHRPQRG